MPLDLGLVLVAIVVAGVIAIAWWAMERDRRAYEAASSPSALFSGLGRSIAIRKGIERRRGPRGGGRQAPDRGNHAA